MHGATMDQKTKSVTAITNAFRELSNDNRAVTSSDKMAYTNDTYTTPTGQTVVYTVRKQTASTRCAFVISGNNDYFHYYELSDALYHAGYTVCGISLPTFGLTQTGTRNHITNLEQQIFACIEHGRETYTTGKIDLLFGHSTGGLLSVAYAHQYAHNVRRIILSSPWVDHYGDPQSTVPEIVQELAVVGMSFLQPRRNMNHASGSYNSTSYGELVYLLAHGKRLFDPTVKRLVNTPIAAEHLRIVFLLQWQLQCGWLRVPDTVAVDVFCSDRSSFWTDTTDSDNAVDVHDIQQFAASIGTAAALHVRPGSIHNQFIYEPRLLLHALHLGK